MKILFFIFSLGLAVPSPLQAAQTAAVEDISDRGYLSKVLDLIQNSKNSIDVSMYQILLRKDPEHPVSQIVSALIQAHLRGVKVRLLLNRHLDDLASEMIPLARRLAAYEYLTHQGIAVEFADASRRLHDKVIVIDGRWVIEGSMNWTQTALQRNWESATLIDSPDYAAQKLKRLRSIPVSKDAVPYAADSLGNEGEMLTIPAVLMTEEKYFPDMLEDKDETIFEFYLSVIASPEGAKQSNDVKFVFTDEELFSRFHLDPAEKQKDKRREAVRLLKKLEEQGLIDLKIPETGADVEITPRIFADQPPASLPQSVGAGYIRPLQIPLNYFKYDYSRRLSFAAEFVYLLCRLEMSKSLNAPWWWSPQEDLSRIYHLHHTTLAAGMFELQRENLIEVVHDDAALGKPFSDRLANRYRVNRLVSPEAAAEQKVKLREKFGSENFDRAARFADILDEPNDPQVLATLLKWGSRYPPASLDAAFQQIFHYERNNPRRSLYYIHGILESMEVKKQ